MRKTEIWVDDVKKYEQLAKHDFSHYAVMDTPFMLTTGKHSVTIIPPDTTTCCRRRVIRSSCSRGSLQSGVEVRF